MNAEKKKIYLINFVSEIAGLRMMQICRFDAVLRIFLNSRVCLDISLSFFNVLVDKSPVISHVEVPFEIASEIKDDRFLFLSDQLSMRIAIAFYYR